jgi:hypothetical protein
MGSYASYLAGMVMGNETAVPNWHIALYYDGTNPLADIAMAEVTGSRIPVANWQYALPYVSNVDTLYVGPLDACVVGGWFLVNGPAVLDVAWVGAFVDLASTPAPITIVSGDQVRFDPDTIHVTFDALVAGITYPPSSPPAAPGGGGGMPG